MSTGTMRTPKSHLYALLAFLGITTFVLLLYTSFILPPSIRNVLPLQEVPALTPPAQLAGLDDLPALCSSLAATKSADSIPSLPIPSVIPSRPEYDDSWTFTPSRDERAYGLTSQQCIQAFPGLFDEIERAVTYRKKIGRVEPKDIDISWSKDGLVRALIFDQQLYILEEKVLNNDYHSPRALAILHALHRAIITSPEPLPDIEFSFSVADVADPKRLHRTVWVLARTAEEDEKWLMSDFGYWSWPLDLVGGYEQIRREISDTEVDFALKKQQAVWRGAIKTNKHRQDLLKATAGKEWADVKNIGWANATEIKAADSVDALSIPEHCQYEFVIQTEGHSYSGRGKYLQNCNSVVIMHKRTWIEPHHSLLVSSGPGQNFVEVEDDFSNLEREVLALLADPEKARRISQNGIETFRDRHLTPASQACYWRQVVKGWAQISFVPAGWEAEPVGNRRKIRGVPFETFVIQAAMPKKKGCKWFAKLLLQC